MTRSEQINELATALAKAQGEMSGAKKDSENPHFRSKYADLASVWEACRAPLAKHGLSIVQSPRLVAVSDSAWMVEVETTLMHAGGQWMADNCAVPVSKVDAQGVGSAITYARRYALAAFTGVAPEDDDGNAAVASATSAQPQAKPAKPEGFDDWLTDLESVADDGHDALKRAWDQSAAEYRRHLTATTPAKWEAIKKKAAKTAVPA